MERQRLRRWYPLLLGMFLWIMCAIPVKAASDEGRVVRVACGMNDCLYLDDAGDPAGICLPYLRQLAWSKNWTLEYVEGSYSECIQNLYDGKVDLMFPVGKADDTENRLEFSNLIVGYQQIGLFAKDDAEIYYEDYQGFDQTKVGLSVGANSEILDEYAKEHGFSYTQVPLNTIQDKIDALNKGTVDMIAFSTLNTVQGGKLVAVLDQVPFYFCTRKEDTELSQELNDAISVAMVEAPDIASDLYQEVLKGSNSLSFTREEAEKIKNTDKVVFGVYDDCLPLAGVNSKGECVGIYVDLLKEIQKTSGLKIEIKPIEDANRLYSYLDDHTVQFVIGLQDLRFSQENADNHLASNAITDYTTVAVSMPDYQFDQAESPSIALTKDRVYLEDYIYSNYPSATITYYDTRRECLDQVHKGKKDATFLNTWEYNYESKNPRFEEMMEWESIRISSVIGLGGTRQSDLEVLSILEKTVSMISSERISDIISSNLNIPYQDFTFEDHFYEVKNGVLIGGIAFVIVLVCILFYLKEKQKYIRNLEAANSAKSEFLSRMSHELRTPLNAIDGYAQLTIENAGSGQVDKDQIRDNMYTIQKASGYLLGIIKDILDVQRMETGKITLQKTQINPREYMKTIVKLIQPMADEKHVSFVYTMENGENNNYQIDSLRVQQVLFNLLYNAVKFTPEKGKVTLLSKVKEKEDQMADVCFVISDTGIGMSREFMETKLYHKFAQENQDLTSPYAGCGNGLAICKQLIDLMGGTIACESKPDQGTTFVITIPAKYEKQKQRRRERRPIPNYDLSGIRVLMCEDNPMNQEMEKRLLERMKCQVEIAEDGKVGVERFVSSKIQRYDIILMDIRMPNMDGLEATRRIRALEREDAKTIPIFAVSANAFPEDVEKSMEAGMNEHLSKPVDARVFYEKISEYCKKEKD